MRETRLYGSEKEGAGTTGPPYPYLSTVPAGRRVSRCFPAKAGWQPLLQEIHDLWHPSCDMG